jgi:hypothetical protein
VSHHPPIQLQTCGPGAYRDRLFVERHLARISAEVSLLEVRSDAEIRVASRVGASG